MQKTSNEGWDLISNAGSGYAKPITAWAVEIEGKIDPADVYPTRATARHVRNTEASVGLYKRVSTRKVVIQIVDGR